MGIIFFVKQIMNFKIKEDSYISKSSIVALYLKVANSVKKYKNPFQNFIFRVRVRGFLQSVIKFFSNNFSIHFN